MKRLLKLLNVTPTDLATQEIEQTQANLKRLDDLAKYHQDLADLYRNGAASIRQTPINEVTITQAAEAPQPFRLNTLNSHVALASFGAAR